MIGTITTAVPMFEMISSSSRKAPKKISLVVARARDVADRVVEHRLVEHSAGIDVTKVMR